MSGAIFYVAGANIRAFVPAGCFRLLTLLFSRCFYYLYGTVVPGLGKFGVSLPRGSRAPYSGIALPRLGEGGCRVDGILSLPDCHTPDPD